ncbi:MAG TPA: hypothetical protein VLF63_00190 [Patescibacteria group bacterium]|nr:hypothetical protein [Patescibacteria group bacterium]
MLIIIATIIIICFTAVILVGAPYLPTLKTQINTALMLADLKPEQTIIELGCGDGRVLLAARKYGLNSIGYEINPILAIIAWLRCLPYKNIKVKWGNYWTAEWPKADAVFVFLINRYMKKLDKKCQDYKHKPIMLMSFAFKIPDKKVIKYKNGIYLYEYK